MCPGGQRVRQIVERSMQEKRVCALHIVLAMWEIRTYMCVCSGEYRGQTVSPTDSSPIHHSCEC